MKLQNKFDRVAPNLANAGSAISRKIKGWHPVKYFWAFGQRLKRKVSKTVVSFWIKTDELGTHLPRIPLSFRTAAEAEAVNIIVGGEFNASSKEGIILSSDDNPEQWKGVEGVEVETVKMRMDLPAEESEEGKVEALLLKSVSKKALKDRSAQMKKVNKKHILKNAEYRKAIIQKKPAEVVNRLRNELKVIEGEKATADAEYTSLRHIATKLKTKELGEKFGNKHAISVIEGIRTKALAFNPETFGSAIDEISDRLEEGWKVQAAMDVEIEQVGRDLNAWVYQDVAEYLDNSPRFDTLVKAKSKHQLVSGTEKLRFATKGFDGRWPGLDFYVHAARDKHGTFSGDNGHIIKALEMMKADMDMMMPHVIEAINEIRHDDQEHDGQGSFDASRMSDYYNLQAWMKTHQQVTEMLVDNDGGAKVLRMIGSFGETIGFEFGQTPEEVETQRNEVAVKYGFSPDVKMVSVTDQMIEAGKELPAPIPRPVTRPDPLNIDDEGTELPLTDEPPLPPSPREIDDFMGIGVADTRKPMYEPTASPVPKMPDLISLKDDTSPLVPQEGGAGYNYESSRPMYSPTASPKIILKEQKEPNVFFGDDTSVDDLNKMLSDSVKKRGDEGTKT